MTSTLHTGSLGGLAGADAVCQARADAVPLGGTYKAWLSDTSTNAADRLVQYPGRYVRTDGMVIANGWGELTSGAIENPIDKTELDSVPPATTNSCTSGGPAVWTNTMSDGTKSTADCAGWTSAASTDVALTGNHDQTSSWWTDICSSHNCDKQALLYCIEQ